MADKKQPNRTCTGIHLALDIQLQGRFVTEKCLSIKAVVDGHNFLVSPLIQFGGKRSAGSDGALRPIDRFFSEDPLQASIQPETVFPTIPKIAIEMSRGVKRVPAQQDLRNSRLPQRKVTCGDEHFSSGVTDDCLHFMLFEPEPPRSAHGIRYRDALNVLERTELRREG